MRSLRSLDASGRSRSRERGDRLGRALDEARRARGQHGARAETGRRSVDEGGATRRERSVLRGSSRPASDSGRGCARARARPRARRILSPERSDEFGRRREPPRGTAGLAALCRKTIRFRPPSPAFRLHPSRTQRRACVTVTKGGRRLAARAPGGWSLGEATSRAGARTAGPRAARARGWRSAQMRERAVGLRGGRTSADRPRRDARLCDGSGTRTGKKEEEGRGGMGKKKQASCQEARG